MRKNRELKLKPKIERRRREWGNFGKLFEKFFV
jgi:hypothetical protein